MLRKSDGAYAELISVKGDAQMKIPESLSDVDAATQGIATGTMVGPSPVVTCVRTVSLIIINRPKPCTPP